MCILCSLRSLGRDFPVTDAVGTPNSRASYNRIEPWNDGRFEIRGKIAEACLAICMTVRMLALARDLGFEMSSGPKLWCRGWSESMSNRVEAKEFRRCLRPRKAV